MVMTVNYVFQPDADDGLRAMLILCYGYVAYFAQPTLIASRVDTQIMKTVVKYLANAKVGDFPFCYHVWVCG